MTWPWPHCHMPCHLSTYGTQNKECTSSEMALWRLGDHGAIFPTPFRKHFSYLCEYAIRIDLSCSYCEYSNIFHCLHCSPSCFDPDSLLRAHLWLQLSWIGCISANKTFYSSKTSSRNPYTSSMQQERHKHSVEITIKLSWSDLLRAGVLLAVVLVGVSCVGLVRYLFTVRRLPTVGEKSNDKWLDRCKNGFQIWCPFPCPALAVLHSEFIIR